MRARHWIAILLMLAAPHVHAEEAETEATLELIELLGVMDEADTDLEIAMSDVEAQTNLQRARAREVDDEE